MFSIDNSGKEFILLDLIDAMNGQATMIVCSQVDPDKWCGKVFLLYYWERDSKQVGFEWVQSGNLM
jgi:hypothetical protein